MKTGFRPRIQPQQKLHRTVGDVLGGGGGGIGISAEFGNVSGAQKSIPPAYVASRAGTANRVIVPTRQATQYTSWLSRLPNCSYYTVM